jgi:hypothetical protein
VRAEQERIERELAAGRAAQAAGNAGRARVCARRAAGLGIRAWFQRRAAARGETGGWGGDALTQLKRVQAEPEVPEAVRAAAARLTTKVDFDHQLPFDDDPLEDAGLILRFAHE